MIQFRSFRSVSNCILRITHVDVVISYDSYVSNVVKTPEYIRCGICTVELIRTKVHVQKRVIQ